MQNIFCDICGIEFYDQPELDGHKNMAHGLDALGADSDMCDGEDPVDAIPFKKIVEGI